MSTGGSEDIVLRNNILWVTTGHALSVTADSQLRFASDYNLFWNGPLQSLCDPCHNRFKQHIETRGYSNAVDVDGRPIDPNHPSHNFK